jgi:hypothetical protein
MKKSLLILAALSLPLSLMAADGHKRHEGHDAPAAAAVAETAASAPAKAREHPAHDPAEVARHRTEQVAEVHAAKDRGSRMGACRKEVQDQGLAGVEMKVAITACLQRAN